jgi:hypothetical protein
MKATWLDSRAAILVSAALHGENTAVAGKLRIPAIIFSNANLAGIFLAGSRFSSSN